MKTRTEAQKDCYKVLIWLVKYLPIISAILLWLHVLLGFLGFDDKCIDHLFNSSIPRASLMVVASYAFGFCRLHRSIVMYNLALTLAFEYNQEIGFKENVLFLHQLIFIILGVILIISMIKQWKTFLYCNKNAKITFKQILKDSGR